MALNEEWISVEETLPSAMYVVLITIRDKTNGRKLVRQGVYYNDKYVQGWRWWQDQFREEYEVTHWRFMPLPAED